MFHTKVTTPRRLSIDQCRGYAILAMMGGNFACHFAFMPWVLTHHPEGFTFAETIAPLFFFTVGMGYRGSFLRRKAADGLAATRKAAALRYTLLIGVGMIIYFGHFWDALSHIGIAGLFLLPVIDRSAWLRFVTAVAGLAFFQVIYLYTDHGAWLLSKPMNGGPLGALSWAFIVMMGTLAWDWVAEQPPRKTMARLASAGFLLMLTGYLLHLPWPGVKEAWPFTRYGMSAPLPLLTAGLACLTYLCFYLSCDRYGIRFPVLSILGENPLTLYAVLGAQVGLSKLIIKFTGEPGFWAALGSLLLIYSLCYASAWWLHRKSIYLRV